MDSTKFSMHDVLKDKVSGLKGVVLGITFYDTGCIHYGLAPQKLKEDGTVHDWTWFDESRLELVKSAVVEKVLVRRSGPDMNARCH
jgi:hypothetical protein